MSQHDNIIAPFLVETLSVRGRVISLGSTLDIILKQHNYPLPISQLLGELVVLVGMLGDMFKSDQLLTLQIKSEGIVDCLIADYMAGNRIRGYASFNETAYLELAAQKKDESLQFSDLVPGGYLAMTIDPQNEKDRYQGIVSLEGASLTACVEQYFAQSEQLQTRINSAVGFLMTPQGPFWRGGGIMVQQMPREGGFSSIETADRREEGDEWNQAALFVASVQSDELLDPTLSAHALLYRLFHEEGVRAYDPKLLIHGCRCSREKAEALIESLTPEQLQEMQVEGAITVTCQFCGKEEVFPVQ